MKVASAKPARTTIAAIVAAFVLDERLTAMQWTSIGLDARCRQKHQGKTVSRISVPKMATLFETA
jgi:hypothetical protein